LNNNLWLYGGARSAATACNDLWKYDISTNQWTWMSGSSTTNRPGIYNTQGVFNPDNFPGGRFETDAAWTDNFGNLWLYGGENGTNCYSDLWKYNIASNQWAWMKGDTVPGVPPVYGTQTVEAPANNPGARVVYTSWMDCTGNMWLFGSGNYFGNQIRNDMWRYSPATNNWAWMKGSNLTLQPGIYGTQCVMSTTSTPGYRYENRAHWTDSRGNFWMMGGGFGTSHFAWNDLWVFSPTNNQWMFVEGSPIANPGGIWGTLGVSAPANVPNGRLAGIGWSDSNGHLYYFGGADNTFVRYYNDLWMYTIDTVCVNFSCLTTIPVAFFTAADTLLCPGSCISFTNMSVGATSYQWFFPGATPSSSTAANPDSICYNTSGTFDVTHIAMSAGGNDTLTFTNLIHIYPQPAIPVITQTVNTLHGTSGYVTYQWFYGSDTIAGATDSLYLATQNGNYNLVVTDTNSCAVGVGIINVVVKGNGLDEFNIQSLMFDVYPNPARDEITVTMFNVQWSMFNLEIYNSLGEKIFSFTLNGVEARTTGKSVVINTSTFGNGIYLVKISSGGNIFTRKIIIAN
jgi:hypothetical protein